jgi:hypothetical protein
MNLPKHATLGIAISQRRHAGLYGPPCQLEKVSRSWPSRADIAKVSIGLRAYFRSRFKPLLVLPLGREFAEMACRQRTIPAKCILMKTEHSVAKRGRTIIVKGPTYFSRGDEKSFFDWLQSIPCVAEVEGKHLDLHVYLKRSPSAIDMVELSTLLRRYRMPIEVLEPRKTARNVKWLKPWSIEPVSAGQVAKVSVFPFHRVSGPKCENVSTAAGIAEYKLHFLLLGEIQLMSCKPQRMP